MATCDVGPFLALGGVALTPAAGHFSAVQPAAVACTGTSLAIVHRLAGRGAVRNVVAAAQLPAALARNEGRGRASVLPGRPGGVLLSGWTPPRCPAPTPSCRPRTCAGTRTAWTSPSTAPPSTAPRAR